MRKFLILLFLIALAKPAWASSLTYKETLGGSGTTGTTITAHANVNTKGSYTSLGTSTAASAYVSIVIDTPQQARAYLVDVAADQAGGTTYVDFVQNIPIETANSATSIGQVVVIPFPMAFASGTQFAARCQSDNGAATVKVHLVLYTGTTPFTVTYVETYGADTATSKGQSVDPGATLNTKGAYTQLTAASASAADYLVPVANPQVAQTTKTAVYMWLDISTGAAASEVVKLGNAEIYEGIEEMDFNLAGAREVDIASGVRVAARAQSQNNTSGRREVDVAVVAFVKSAAPPASGAGTGRIIP